MPARPLATLVCALLVGCAAEPPSEPGSPPENPISVAPSGRYFQQPDGSPFFWLGDTAWLLFQRLDRDETLLYFDDRQAKGFNVIQVMVVRTADDANAYGAAALEDGDFARPRTTDGAALEAEGEYDYWDHVDWVIDRAAERGMRIGMVAAWGSNARGGALTEENVEPYARFLVERFRDKPNLVWLVGGDTHGDRETGVWTKMGETFAALDPDRLVTFHPFGRTQSSTWFHSAPWLDFNLFQSGHRRYDQDDIMPEAKGEDNWRYVFEDRALEPPKPTLDGEPSYEGIPQGLHDPAEPYWVDRDVRRYAWWSVFAGAAGHTYGHSAIMQMHGPEHGDGAYGVRETWREALAAPGAGRMQHLKRLMLSRPYFERVPDFDLVTAGSGERYERVVATRGDGYVMAYAYLGKPFTLRTDSIAGERLRAWWYDPRTGEAREIGEFDNAGELALEPPSEQDWAVVLDDASAGFGTPGAP